jgi:hypothetical protein
MRRSLVAWVLATSLAATFPGGPGAQAAELTVATYYELTVARLQFVVASWEQLGRGPGDDEMTNLWQRYDTTPQAYYAFASLHAAAVEAYLAARPDLQEAIDHLRAEIRALIQQRESQ